MAQLDDFDSRKALVAALEAGDPELEEDIDRQVRHEMNNLGWGSYLDETEGGMEPDEFIWMVRHWAQEPGAVFDEDDPPKLSAVIDYVRDADDINELLEPVPEAKVEEELLSEVELAAEDVSRRIAGRSGGGRHSGSRMFEFASGRGGGIDLRPIQQEIVLNFDEPLGWVPEEKMVKLLDAHGPADADWSSYAPAADDLPTYYSGFIDGYEYWRLEIKSSDLLEWAVDLRTEYFSELVDADPEEAIKAFQRILTQSYPALAKRVKKAKFPKDVLADYAVAFFEDQEQGLQIISEAVGAWGYEGTRGETLLEVDKAALQALGITQGRWWDGAPWKLLNLPVEELAYEGTLMRHCVGRFDMGYRNAVARGVTQIWSLRSRFNRPILTFEINVHDWRSPNAIIRAGAIEQLKGKLNRLAGGDADEARVLFWIFAKLGVDPSGVEDFVGESHWHGAEPFEPGPEPNPGFNAPWRPYHDRRYARLMRWG